MAENKGSLRGKTVFITGASRGIGLAIALKCAKDGANIVIAAKTAKPHPKLPGTIYTAAKEVEDAGGRCLPCIVDVRSEDDVKSAVQKAVDTFGGIDILVNNASAIDRKFTEDTKMKSYDLMQAVNTRGTFMCSKYCAPYLRKSSNAHILTLSPPLNMNPGWFAEGVAYTISKYGMSMCALGMAEEFREDKIAVNTLWPRTFINTAASQNMGFGAELLNMSRKPNIMSDAAYIILCKDSATTTGNFFLDDEVIASAGITDFDQYNYVKNPSLAVDIFVDEMKTFGKSKI
ncbi:hypothetical protein CAPTEDRAFT_225857 [Capitella teleta]|uniref:Hydroxysteroid dehydrogenase-like protein 2 n=1 Tax=Capitella teleta TaxID=283909 RepID=R7TSZ6_CAPTE|nr:hypothetical protein CAPTEDRAFT_225857 [Capitella teleta]|eukprot:ELT94611.1 hypothetical protein CAPTEDRAFT_225857 [Capitella teleta]